MNRRLIGATIITVALCGWVADYLFLRQSPWSVSRFLDKFLQIFAIIFTPSIKIADYSWLGPVIMPVSVILIVVLLIWISLSRAKRAMSIATPDVKLNRPS